MNDERRPEDPVLQALWDERLADAWRDCVAQGEAASDPRPDPLTHPEQEDTWKGVYPGMCVDPETCRGHSACPRNYSCCE